MYISNIRLEHIRGFRKLDLSLSENNAKARLRTVILGKNGTCKSTLLRCIAIGLCDRADGNALIAEPIGRLVAENSSTALIEITLQSLDKNNACTISTTIKNQNGKDIVDDQEGTLPSSPDLFVCGYGVGRSDAGPETGRKYRIIDSVYTLFQYDQTLIDPELTLRRLKDYLGTKLYKQTMNGIKKSLILSPRDSIDLPKGGGVVLSGPSIGKRIPLEGWADGYRITLMWILDLFAWAMRAGAITPSAGIRGILLIDELEQHLHPSMQTDALDRISELFPELQILTTTHSPLVALGTSQKELVVLQRKGKYVYSEQSVPDFSGYSAEDMLVDDKLFNTDVYSPEINKKLRRYHNLKKIPQTKRTRKEINELRLLAKELMSQQIPEVRENPLTQELKRFREKYDL